MNSSSQTWGLWDMKRFHAGRFAHASALLAELPLRMLHERLSVTKTIEELSAFSREIEAIRDMLFELDLTSSWKKANEIYRVCGYGDYKNYDFATALQELNHRIREDLDSKHFITLTPAEDDFFDPKAHPFGPEILAKFPSATFDIEEASKCMAIGRYTACVFHLMRVMEIALHAIHNCLGLPPGLTGNDRTWGSILQKIRNEYIARPNFSERQFFQQSHWHLDAVKDAWRNGTMHIENRYTEAEAMMLYMSIKSYLQFLSSRMDENGLPLA